MSRKPTIIDVARRARVSTATVSRVINGGPVGDGTREAVERAIRELGYRRNTLARGLVTGRTGVVGVLIPELPGPLYGEVARGIEEILGPRGMHALLVSDHRDPDEERAAVELLLARQVDALIVAGSLSPAVELAAAGGATPVVLLGPEADDGPLPTIRLDNRGGVRRAVDHLLAHGHRRIAHIAGLRRDGRERRRAFEEALRDAGLAPDLVFEGDFSEERGADLAPEVAASGATAVLCANDRTAVGLYHGLRGLGLRVPGDLSVVGFDDLPWGAYLAPPLTTVRQPGRVLGRRAALLALEPPAEGAPPPDPVLIRPELIQRASVAVAAGAPRR